MSNRRSRSRSPLDPNREWNFDTNPFSIIGITLETEATPENVKKNYHLKILGCHPDKQEQDGMVRGNLSNAATEVTTAYNFLKGKDEPTLKRRFREFQPSTTSTSSSMFFSAWASWFNNSSAYSNSNYNHHSSKTSGKSNASSGSGNNGGAGESGGGRKRTFSNSNGMKTERKVYQFVLSCSVCKQPFQTQAEAKTHITMICGLVDLKAHVVYKWDLESKEKKFKEETEPLFVCETCGKGFDTLTKTVDHEKVHLSGIQCSHCRASVNETDKDEAGKAEKSPNSNSKADATATSSSSKTMK